MTRTHQVFAVLLLSFSGVLAGCTAMQALESAGDEFSQGNILAGLWNSTMGVVVGGIVDVVTLGGTATPEEGLSTITTTANAARSTSTQSSYTPSPSAGGSSGSVSAALAHTPASYSSAPNTLYTSTPNSTLAAGGAASSTSPAQMKPVRLARHCVTWDKTSSKLADYQGNTCDYKIFVTWFASDGHCRNGCSNSMDAHRARSSISKQTGQVVYAACEYPVAPKNPDGGRWTGGAQHICARH